MIIARSVWGAKPASLSGIPMRLPATQVFLHHTVTPVTANLTADVRTIESIGIQRFGCFSYSYVIHPHDGEIYEGSGLMRGAHTAQRNSTSFGIAWIGNYSERQPKIQQIEATRWLIADLTKRGHLLPGADIEPHNSVYATACPGSKLMPMLDVIRVPWVAPKGVTPMFDPPHVLEPIVAELLCPSGGVWLLASSGAVYAYGGAPYLGAPRDHDYFTGRKAARLQLIDNKYRVIAESGEGYGPGFG